MSKELSTSSEPTPQGDEAATKAQARPNPFANNSKDKSRLYDTGLGPVILEPYARETANRLTQLIDVDKASDKNTIFETACGTGLVTRHIRELFPKHSILATDFSPEMLSIAEDKFFKDGQAEHLKLEVADAGALPYDDNSFDANVFQFGIMFLEDKAKAIKEAQRVLKPGGVFMLTTWDDLAYNPLLRLFKPFLLQLVKDKFDFDMDIQGSDAAFLMNDDAVIREYMEAASFTDINIERVTLPTSIDDPLHFARGLLFGSMLTEQLQKATGGDLDKVAELEQAVVDFFDETFGVKKQVHSITQAVYITGKKQ